MESYHNGSGGLDREVGRLEGRVSAHDSDIKEIKADLKNVLATVTDIKTTVDQAKGGWKALATAGGVGGVTTGLLLKFSTLFGLLAR